MPEELLKIAASEKMADSTGPPTGKIPYMTPFTIASDPPTPKPIPDISHPHLAPRERAAERFSLTGKHAIVTGGAQGLGLVCARALLDHGVTHLAIFDVDDQKGSAAINHFRGLSIEQEPALIYLNVDVTDEKAVNDAVADVSRQFVGIDILLCFAGITGCQLAVDYNVDDWRKIMDVNITGSFLVARAVARDIISRNSSGSIVFTASMSGYIVNQPQPQSAYAVSKAGVHHLTRSLAGEWVGHNIRVNSISPGVMNTRLSGGEAQAGLRKLWMPLLPMGIGDPEDLTGPVILLCSPAGRFITGTDIVIDGKVVPFSTTTKLRGGTAKARLGGYTMF